MPQSSASSPWRSLLVKLESRFLAYKQHFPDLDWEPIQRALEQSAEKQTVLLNMEATGGEPALVKVEENQKGYWFFDCSPESPPARRSLCYDATAWNSRKANKPVGNVCDVAAQIGVSVLTEDDYFTLQRLGPFDNKTSSWLHTPVELRNKGGALFGDHRFGRTFIYHNGAESYYAARGFRGKVKVEL